MAAARSVSVAVSARHQVLFTATTASGATGRFRPTRGVTYLASIQAVDNAGNVTTRSAPIRVRR